METRKETQALGEPTRIIVVSGRAIICQPGAINEAGRVVRPDLMPQWIQRPNRRERRRNMRFESKRQH